MIKKRLLSLSVILSVLVFSLVYGQMNVWAQGFSYLQPAALPAAYGNLYFSGQPAPSDFKTLEKKGFDVIINIRGPREMTFDEKAVVTKAGMTYYILPLMKDGRIINSAVTRIFVAVKANKGKKILLHCSSGNRAASWLGATLVRDLGYNRQTAITLAKKAGMTKARMEKILQNYLDSLAK